MSQVWSGILEGLRLLFSGDPAQWEIIFVSLRVSGLALLISGLIGIPLGALLGMVRFPGKRLAQALIYTGMGLPPVVVGLAVYLLLSRSGVLGPLNWPWVPQLFTLEAMI
jgi:tungstate transport system permease protein